MVVTMKNGVFWDVTLCGCSWKHTSGSECSISALTSTLASISSWLAFFLVSRHINICKI
jgi:hypothetical protein